MKHRFFKAFALILLPLMLIMTSCAGSRTVEGFALGTFYSVSADSVFSSDDIQEILFGIEQKFSVAEDNSEIARINAAAADVSVTVSEETMLLIRNAFAYSIYEDAQNAFNPAVFPLVSLWGFAPPYLEFADKTPPGVAEIAEALSVSSISKFSLDGNTVTKSSSLAALDLGGIAKGYAADKIAQYFKEKGVKSALINVGGTLISYEKDSVIGIKRPRDNDYYYIASFTLDANSACATSGDYERFYIYKGERYHHIIDSSGYPADSGLIAVTVIASSAEEADALSTMAFVLGEEDAPQMLRAYGAKGALVTSEKEIISVDLDLTLKDETYTIRSA